ncbi:unnamed protein product [Pedinophyceae sp. YPF-701]|nr:unnamed protein product [Pedinophyceae sp. YPF-701]
MPRNKRLVAVRVRMYPGDVREVRVDPADEVARMKRDICEAFHDAFAQAGPHGASLLPPDPTYLSLWARCSDGGDLALLEPDDALVEDFEVAAGSFILAAIAPQPARQAFAAPAADPAPPSKRRRALPLDAPTALPPEAEAILTANVLPSEAMAPRFDGDDSGELAAAVAQYTSLLATPGSRLCKQRRAGREQR